MKKIRILYTIPNFDTAGSGLALIKLASNLNKERFTPMIVCLHDKGRLFDEVKASGIPVYIYNYLAPLKPRTTLFIHIFRIARFFRKLNPDIVFSYHYSSDFSEALAAKLAGAKFLYVKKNMGWKGASYNQWRIKTWLANAITVQNTDMINLFFPNTKKAYLISIGVDTTMYYPKNPNKELRYSLGIRDSYKVILCVANIIPKKGIDFLLYGFAKIKKGDNVKLLIVGDNTSPLGKKMVLLAEALQISKDVIFTGKRFDVPEIYNIADLFILPSTGDEGAPIAIQEAMASGIVVITTDTPGNRDQLNELPEQLIKPSDPGAIASAIAKFLHLSSEDRNHIVSKQLEIINKRYSLTQEVNAHEELYNRLIRT
jgi:glycosyltransferase involved in cell wall biosynthesis